jgi:hypothetical protein
MRDDDLHLPEACAGALAMLVLLVAVPTGEPHAYGAGARPAR